QLRFLGDPQWRELTDFAGPHDVDICRGGESRLQQNQLKEQTQQAQITRYFHSKSFRSKILRSMLNSVPAYPYTAEQVVNQVQGGLAMRILIALLTALFCHGTVAAKGLTRVMSGYAAISGPHAVLWVARETSLFEK